MRLLRSAAYAFAALALTAGSALARADEDWQKAYPVSAKPSLTFSTGDAATDVRSCNSCREIHIRVQWNDRRASDYVVTESQAGDHVNFELHEKVHMHFGIGSHHEPQVSFETPATIDIEGHTTDGSLRVSGVQGEIVLRTSDGAVDVADVSGAVRLTASDGSIRMHNLSGTLESRSSDGSVHIDGRFTGVQVHTSDGSLDLTLADGSKLATASRIESSDGRVSVRVPRDLAADLEIHTSDGHIQCDLPLVMQGYDSRSDSGHGIRGRLNGGGVPLNIHTSDGNVTIAAL